MSNLDSIISSLNKNVSVSDEHGKLKIDGSKFGRTMVNPSFKATSTVSINPSAESSTTSGQVSQMENNSAITPSTVPSGTVQYQATSHPVNSVGTSNGVTMSDLVSSSQTNNS